MNKTDFIQAVADRTGESYAKAEGFYNASVKIITDELVKGEKIQMTGFGLFETATRAAREARNPRTGEKIQVTESKVAKFRAGKVLKEALNG